MPDILGMDLSFLHNTGVGDVEIPVKDKKRLLEQWSELPDFLTPMDPHDRIFMRKYAQNMQCINKTSHRIFVHLEHAKMC